MSFSDSTIVYDHKMLWRANLYIDETDDWNDEHRWVEGNEWNHDIDGNVGDGGQVIDLADSPWTRFYLAGSLFSNATTRVENRLPYTSGGSDTPFSMMEKLESQRVLLEHYMQEPLLGVFTGGGPNTTWPEPVAPGSFVSPFIADNSNSWNNYLKTGDQLTIDGTITYPYRPSYSSVAGIVSTYQSSQVEQSIGADCSGFIQRCASYINSPYLSGSTNRDNSDDYITDLADVDLWPGTNYELCKKRLEGVTGIDNASYEIPERIYLVPGDILKMNGHVVIVQDIIYDDNNITNDDILVIEAAGTGTEWTIDKTRSYSSLLDYIDYYGVPVLKRLNVNE
ncbi:MAG: hypothetical protein PF447_01860 [Spirochaetaceae bacterium]|jgi:hypothetical protein|nr:hypothetical protein [Spirochaetaceae bacterium]